MSDASDLFLCFVKKQSTSTIGNPANVCTTFATVLLVLCGKRDTVYSRWWRAFWKGLHLPTKYWRVGHKHAIQSAPLWAIFTLRAKLLALVDIVCLFSRHCCFHSAAVFLGFSHTLGQAWGVRSVLVSMAWRTVCVVCILHASRGSAFNSFPFCSCAGWGHVCVVAQRYIILNVTFRQRWLS